MQTRCKKLVRNIIITVISIAIYNIYAFSNTYADDTITITLPSTSVNLPITPTSSGVFNSTDINVQVTTSNTAGYTLSMTAADVNLTRTAAVNGSTPTIPTFTSLSGYTSGTTYSQASFPTGYWGYKLSSDTNYSPISSSITIADPDESTANTAISNVITFAAKLDNSKPAGSYATTLTFIAIGKTPPDPTLYGHVEALALQKGGGTAVTQSLSALRTVDAASSGVYLYNSSVFGAASDVAGGYPIYYYRGILDSNLNGASSTYGSNGDGATWPNYVKLANDTCWRIVRTTASGGVKMIYNGLYSGGTTANSCANAQANAQVTTQAFNSSSNSIVYVGYTYNSSYTTNSNTNNVSPDTVFSSGSNPTSNNTRSTIKTYIEDTWWPSVMGDTYLSMMEPNAGYCNDRSYYGATTGTTLAQIQSPISTSGNVYFGARNRHLINDAVGPTLNCTRGDVDIYRYASGSTGTSNQLKVPAALLTADEAALAGSGRSSGNPTAYNYNSFLRSGSNFWLLSPYNRNSNGIAVGFYLGLNGDLGGNGVGNSYYGVRPVISLAHFMEVSGGTGTATNPWTVALPSNAISFTIAGTTYYAESGMTWSQWAASPYNTGGFYMSGTYLKRDSGWVMDDQLCEWSTADVQITNDHSYYIQADGPEFPTGCGAHY